MTASPPTSGHLPDECQGVRALELGEHVLGILVHVEGEVDDEHGVAS